MTTFTTYARNLKDFLEPLLRCAGSDDMLPVLTGIKLTGIDGTLVGASTDRFRMAFHRTAVKDYEGDDFAILIPAAALKRMLGVFRAVRSHNPVLSVTVDDKGLTVTDYEAAITIRPLDGNFPDVAHLINKAAEADPTTAAPVFGVNAKYLGTIAGSVTGRDNTTAVRAPIGLGPILFQPTEDLLILLVPRRLADGDTTPTVELDSWVRLLGGKA